MKKTMVILVCIALALILLVGGLLWYFFSLLPKGRGEPDPNADVAGYLSENWTIFRVRSWDAEAAALELDYDLPFTYDQVMKYAGVVEEIPQTPEGNLVTIRAICETVEQELGVSIRKVTVYGLTADGKTAYTACSDGTISACWDGAEFP